MKRFCADLKTCHRNNQLREKGNFTPNKSEISVTYAKKNSTTSVSPKIFVAFRITVITQGNSEVLP